MKNALKILVVLALALLVPTSVAYTQNYHTNSKKAVKHYESARKKYDKKKYSKTFKYLDKALNADAVFTDALLLKAELSLTVNDKKKAVESFERMFAADSSAFPKSAITLAKLYLENFNFKEAVDILKWYVKVPDQKDALVLQAQDLLEIAEFRYEAYNNPVSYNAVSLGANVNTDGDEYINQILPDGSRIYFTRRSNELDKQGFKKEFVYSSAILDGEYMPAVPLNIDWHNNKRMGAVSLSANLNKMYFVGIDFIDSYGRGDIYTSDFVDNEWTKPVNLGKKVNTTTMESQPCISADGKELYFVRLTKTKRTDIYYTKFYQGEWTSPQAVESINSKGSEMSPFIHPDGNTLYFASDGHPGMGGYDIFICKKLPEGGWTSPVNLGYPVNSEKNEISFAVSADGKKGYISSDREGGMGGYDIYVFDLDEADSPEPVDMKLFVMRNVNFEFDSPVLDESSFEEIDALAEFMKKNPSIRIEIAGHTDNSGSDEYNNKLSLSRAKAVKNALVKRGIKAGRMSAAGYGASRPLVPNDSEENMALNRRVEVRVVH